MLWILHIKGAFVLGKNDFRKSFSPKPACLAATENEIFQKFTSCWPKFTPLTWKWIYTLIFTSIHFRKEREREREREKREPRSERERKKRLRWWSRRSSIMPLVDRDCERARWLTSSAIDEQSDRLTSALVDHDRRSRHLSDDRTDLAFTAQSHLLLCRAISIWPDLMNFFVGFCFFCEWVWNWFIICMFIVEEVYEKLGM